MQRYLASLFLLLASAVPAVAQCDAWSMAYLYGYRGFNFSAPAYGPTPPYFALHPPVYYGARYTRPYGVSPYAAWPQLQANPSYAPRPAVDQTRLLANPYCSTEGNVVPSSGPANSGPLVINNPYYNQTRHTALKID
ncbi:MAG: hypothetical protein KDB03_12570 [Planctomycetales bacterium]|nr:hypothetical protein [Planctomycetales bacterium]